MSEQNNKPIDEVKLARIKASIWRNEGDAGQARYSVSVGRLYKNADGKWRTSDSFARDDLLLLAKVANLVHTRVCRLELGDRSDGEPG